MTIVFFGVGLVRGKLGINGEMCPISG